MINTYKHKLMSSTSQQPVLDTKTDVHTTIYIYIIRTLHSHTFTTLYSLHPPPPKCFKNRTEPCAALLVLELIAVSQRRLNMITLRMQIPKYAGLFSSEKSVLINNTSRIHAVFPLCSKNGGFQFQILLTKCVPCIRTTDFNHPKI